jgi:deazaflavin-dependent oxidoreductase (nitroreductase family)
MTESSPHMFEHEIPAEGAGFRSVYDSRTRSARATDTGSLAFVSMLFGQEHVDRYRATDGEEGHKWQGGSKVLLLTTRGRKSGEQRTTPLIYAPHGDDYMVVASKGGSDAPPAWYLNLSEEPEVEVQVKGDVFRARARTASAEEQPEMWRTMVAEWPAYDQYQERTERRIPVVVLERA